MRLGRAVFVRALLAGVLVGVGCEPQDAHLFDPLPAPEAGGAGGGPPVVVPPRDSGAPPVVPPPFAGSQPTCQTPACEACVVADRCAFGASPGRCHPSSGQCALPCDPDVSAANAIGSCPRGSFCHPEHGLCVACRDGGDCAAPTAACDPERSVCVECIDATTCSAPLVACDTAAQTCVECVSGADCQVAGRRVCDTSSARCVQCADDDDCGGETPRCRLATQLCVECLSDDDCRLDPEKPRCKLDELECDDD